MSTYPVKSVRVVCEDCHKPYEYPLRDVGVAPSSFVCISCQYGQLKAPRAEDGPSKHDTVNHPSHYTAGGIECIDAIEAATQGLQGLQAVCTANVIKYVWRQSHKNGLEDLKKAQWYLQKLIDSIEK